MEKLRSTDLLNQFSQRKMKTNLIKQEDLVSYTRRGNAHNLRPARPFHVHDNLWFLSPDLPAPPAPPARWMAGRSGLRHTSCCLLDTSFCSKHSLSDPGFNAGFFFSISLSLYLQKAILFGPVVAVAGPPPGVREWWLSSPKKIKQITVNEIIHYWRFYQLFTLSCKQTPARMTDCRSAEIVGILAVGWGREFLSTVSVEHVYVFTCLQDRLLGSP